MASMTRPLPLAGVTVVALEQAVAVPLATRKLADAGARVIKIERPEGDFARGYDRMVLGQSSHFVWTNRGKESCVVDLKNSDDAAFLHRMIARADVFIQNLAPGAAARAGFGAEELRRRHPRLITCDVSGYGHSGEYSEMRAYDTLVQGESGLMSITGTAESASRVGISICDISAGIHAYAAILEALISRERTGDGVALEVSLFASMADWMAVPVMQWTYAGRAPERTGLEHPGIAPYGPFQSADGDTVLLAVQNDREWVRLCEQVLQRPELAKDPRLAGNPGRMEHRAEVDGAVAEAFARYGTSDLIQRLMNAELAFGRVNSVEALATHPQLGFMEVETPAGMVRMPPDPVTWRASGGEEARAEDARADEAGGERDQRGLRPSSHGDDRAPRVPSLGDHSDALRAEFSE
jgi:itaconate CoA-transferase